MAARTKVFVDIKTTTDGKEPGSGLKKFAIGAGIATAALVVLVKAGKEWSKAASDAEEIGSKFATIFRDISDDAEAMADSFAENFGLAGSTSRELLGNTADLLTGLGFTQQGALDLSEQVNTLAADLASFSNFAGGTTGASEALTKALLGEAESVKALGIVINQNTQEYKDAIKFYTEVEGKTLLQAKAFTALQFATEQSGNAIGDVTRTWESHANVQRRLEESTKSFKEEMGAFVNQGATPLLSITDKMVTALGDWLGKVNEARIMLKDLEDGSVGAEVSLQTLQENLETLQNITITGGIKGADIYKDQIVALELLILNYDHVHDRISRNKSSQEAFASLQKLSSDEADAAAIIALDRQEQLAEAFVKTKEGQILTIEKQIEFFETFEPQGPKAIAILRDLNEELEDLTKKEKDALITAEKLFGGRTTVAEEWLAKQQMIDEAYIASVEATSEAEKKAAEVARDLFEQRIENGKALASQTLSFLSAIDSLQSNNADAELMRMEENGASQEELDAKKRQIAHDEASRQKALALLSIGVNTAAAIVSALVSIPPNVPLSVAIGVTGAAQLAAAAAIPIPSLATGGQFITDGPTLIDGKVMGDNASGQERVTVEPLGGGDSGGSSRETFRLVGPGNELLGWIQRVGIDNGGLHPSGKRNRI